MKVVHVIDRLATTGGAETSLVQLLPHLGRRGVDNVVLTVLPHGSESRVRDVRALGVDVVTLEATSRVAAVAGVRRTLAELRPDLVHATLHEAAMATRVASIGLRVPVVVSVVNTPYTRQALTAYGRAWKVAPHRLLDGLLTRHATASSHALSEAVADHMVTHLHADSERIRVIPRGRDRSRLGQPSRERRHHVRQGLGVSLGQPVVLNVARLERQKGQHLLVEAMATVVERHPSAVLLVAGREGTNAARIRAEVDERGLRDHVRLLGARDDVPDLLAAADVFAFSSLFEGLGGSVIEAMAMDVPVVAFDAPAVAEALGGTGTLVRMADVHGLGEAIAATLDDPAGARRRAESARTRFERHFGLARIADLTVAWYQDVVAGSTGSRRAGVLGG